MYFQDLFASVWIKNLGHTNLIPWLAGAPNLVLGARRKIKKGVKKINFIKNNSKIMPPYAFKFHLK
jgi:hypothetical protein